MSNRSDFEPDKPRRLNFPVPIIAAALVLILAATGIVLKLGPDWRYVTDGTTAIAVILLVWEIQRQRQRAAENVAKDIRELLRILRKVKPNPSIADLKNYQTELQLLETEILSRPFLRR